MSNTKKGISYDQSLNKFHKRRSLSEVDQELVECITTIRQKSEEFSKVKSQYQELNAKYYKLHNENWELISSCKILQNKHNDLKRQHSKLRNEHIKVVNQLESSKDLSKYTLELKNNCVNLNNQLQKVSDEKEFWQIMYEMTDAQRDRLKSIIIEMRDINNQLTVSLVDRGLENINLKKAIKEKDGIISDKDQRIDLLDSQLGKLISRYEEGLDAKSNLIILQKHTIEKLELEQAQSEAINQDLVDQLKDLREQISILTIENTVLRSASDAKKISINITYK